MRTHPLRRLAPLLLAGYAAACPFPVAAADAPPGPPPAGLKILKSALRFDLIEFPQPRPTPDIALSDLTGTPVRLADLRGKIVLLNFWATWCPPCIEEMPSMEKLHRHFRGNPLEVVAIAMDKGPPEPVRQFVEKGNFTFRILLDPEGTTEKPFGVLGLPISYVIDEKGRMIAGAIGAKDWGSRKAIAYFEALIRKIGKP